ncbi:MAG: hypothetical protein HRT47_05470 [Candidatus Caenarcaniphilales bacterium]|nr:hypothetical protein [Candidatus Caenarcaniphilales bacterium]
MFSIEVKEKCINQLLNFGVDSIFVNKSQIILSQANTLFLDCKSITHANNLGEDESFKFNRIKTIGDDVYLANSQGLQKNQKYIFEKFAVINFELIDETLFLATNHGVFYTDFDDDIEFFNIPELNFRIFEIVQSPWKKGEIYIATEQGIYLYKVKSRKLQDLNSKLKLGPGSQINFARLKILELYSERFLCLLSDRGIFTLFKSKKKWQSLALTGLKSNAEGDYEFLDIDSIDSNVILVLKSGLYYSSFIDRNLSFSSWQKLNLGIPRGDDFTEGFTATHLFKEEEALHIYLANFRGEVFELYLNSNNLSGGNKNNDISWGSQRAFNQLENDDLNIRLKLEPSINELHKHALRFAAIPTGAKLRSYRLKARLRNFLPELDTYFDNSDYSLNGLSVEGRDEFNSKESAIKTSFEENQNNVDDNELEFGFRLNWKFGNLLYDPELIDIVNSSRIIANVRENLLAELNQIYFQRKELLISMVNSAFKRSQENYLELERFTANLDARTGAWFSKEFNKRKKKFLRRNK